MGNHDHPNEDGSQGNLDHLIDFFNLNVASEYCTKKQIQNVYLISMNTQDTNVEVNGGTQHLFVQAALAEAAAAKAAGDVDWIIVTVHKPLICAESDHPADEEGARALYQAMFNSNQVDFVVSGHNHLLEISHPLSAPTTQQFTETDEGYDFRQAHGQIYMLSGGGVGGLSKTQMPFSGCCPIGQMMGSSPGSVSGGSVPGSGSGSSPKVPSGSISLIVRFLNLTRCKLNHASTTKGEAHVIG